MLKSIKSTRIITVGGSLLCAAGIGYFMQMTDSRPAAGETVQVAAARMIQSDAVSAETATPDPVIETMEEAPAGDAVAQTEASFEEPAQNASAEDVLSMDDITFTAAAPAPPAAAPQPSGLPAEPVTLAALEDAPITALPTEEAAPAFSCEISMTAEPTAAALVTLSLDASCLVNERFTLHHNGMMFSAVTDDEGKWSADVPALSAAPVFIVAFPNGEGAMANATVDSLEYYDRYVLQWKGHSGLQIHALEYGADYGEPGHVWADAARDMASAARGEGGFMMRLGADDLDEALMAEIYTFPTGTALREGDVEISLEAEVTTANCGRDIEAQALIKSGDGVFGARDLTLAMPECTAAGDFLVLKNLYEDLKIARN